MSVQRTKDMRPALLIIGYFACVLLYVSCKKGSEPPAPPSPTPVQPTSVVVTSLSPQAGSYSAVVTITGSGFSTIAAEDTVKFNGKTAIVQQATTTQLIVSVPLRADTGKVTVAVGKQAGTGPVFNYIFTYKVITLAGTGVAGFADGSGSSAQFNYPAGVVTDIQGNVYVADFDNHRIRKITPSGMVSTIAGDGSAGSLDGAPGSAQFNQPAGLAFDTAGNMYVTDQSNNRIRKIMPGGMVSTVSGSTNGYSDGRIQTAKFFYPYGLATDIGGNIYIGDEDNNRIRKILPTGEVSTLAGHSVSNTFPDGGGGTGGYLDGDGANALFSSPHGVATDTQGNVYIADYGNSRIRKITPGGVVSTLAGNSPGFADGIGTAALFDLPVALTVDRSGNVYVVDLRNEKIRRISPAGVVTTLAGNGQPGFADGDATTAQFNMPWGIAVDTQGNVFLADSQNHRIREMVLQ